MEKQTLKEDGEISKIKSPAKKKVKKEKPEKKETKQKIKKQRPKHKRKSINPKNIPSLKLKKETDIAMDFAIKTYKRFDKIVKSIILFGSTAKQETVVGSDIDIIIVIDDVSVSWDQELIAWYREELEKIIKANPYSKELHINTIKLSTWWEDLMKGDPVIINILRYGEAMIDAAGFFNPIKFLLINGKIKSTPEAVYNLIQRSPMHFSRSKASELNCIEGLYWAMVDSAHAALISANVIPPSPEHIPIYLKENFVDSGKLKLKYVTDYRDLLILHKKISHGEITDLKGVEIDSWQEKTEDFMKTMVRLVNDIISEK